MTDARDVYFAYGSNMDPAQMTFRELDWERAEGGVLEGYRLAFDFDARGRWLGGAADIVLDGGSAVEGILYVLAGDISSMDDWEGGYRRLRVAVRPVPGGEEVMAWTYEVVDKGASMNPSEVYVDQMLAGARRFGLSAGYVSVLEDLRARGHEELGLHVVVVRTLARAGSSVSTEDLAGPLGLAPGRLAPVLADLLEWGWLDPPEASGRHRLVMDRVERAPWVLM